MNVMYRWAGKLFWHTEISLPNQFVIIQSKYIRFVSFGKSCHQLCLLHMLQRWKIPKMIELLVKEFLLYMWFWLLPNQPTLLMCSFERIWLRFNRHQCQFMTECDKLLFRMSIIKSGGRLISENENHNSENSPAIFIKCDFNMRI